MKDIRNKNSKYQYHGYQEWYPHNSNNTLFRSKIAYRSNMKNGKLIGYSELHYMYLTEYHIR